MLGFNKKIASKMRFIKYGFVVLFAAVCCTACLKTEKAFLYELRVFVIDEDGEPVVDAEVLLRYNKTGENDFHCSHQQGCYIFTDLSEPGTYQVRVHKRGNEYKDDFKDVKFEEVKVEVVELKLVQF